MTDTHHILVVDDHRDIRDLVGKFLTQHGDRVSMAADGRAMRKTLDAGRIDLVVLDLMLPGEDGLSLCRRLRADSDMPVIMLTAMGEETDRIVGLEMGADDYLAKPFNPRELLARIKAVLRRAQGLPRPDRLGGDRTAAHFAGWTLDLARGRAANVFDRSIDTQVSRLRRKIEDDPAAPRLIKTVWGDGYMFTPEITAS